jgi:hypothetical protein
VPFPLYMQADDAVQCRSLFAQLLTAKQQQQLTTKSFLTRAMSNGVKQATDSLRKPSGDGTGDTTMGLVPGARTGEESHGCGISTCTPSGTKYAPA